jgi:hypothetical protein
MTTTSSLPTAPPPRHNVLREPYRDAEIINALKALLGDLPLPPEPVSLTSSTNVIYTVRLTSEQSKVVSWLFAHPSLRLDRINPEDGWTRTNKRARVVLDALVGVKVEKGWLQELMEYWEDLPKSTKQTLKDRYSTLVAPRDDDDAPAGSDGAYQPSSKKRRRRTEEVQPVSPTPSSPYHRSSHDGPIKQDTTTASIYDELNKLYDDIHSAADRIQESLRKYKDVAFALQDQEEEYERHELSIRNLRVEREALDRTKLVWETTREQAAKTAEDELKRKSEQVDQRAAQLEAEHTRKLELIDLQTVKAEHDLAEASRERQRAEETELRLGLYTSKTWLRQPSLLLQAVRDLQAEPRDDKVDAVLHQVSLLVTPGSTKAPVDDVTSSSPPTPSTSPPPTAV